MKKLVSVLLAAAAALALSACSKTADSDLAQVQENGVMKIGVTNYPPMNYMDENGEWTGFDTDFAKAVCEKLGVEAEFVEISWEAKETELSSRNIDCLWNGMCITEERKEMWNVSEPYMNNTQAMVMKADKEAEIMADISGKNVVSEAGSTGEEKLLGVIDDSTDPTVEVVAKDYFKDAKYTGVSSMATALMDVSNGVADVALVDYVIALGMVGGPDSELKDLVINTDNNFGDQFFGIAFRKDSDIRDKVNEIAAEMKADGSLAEIAKKYGLEDSIK